MKKYLQTFIALLMLTVGHNAMAALSAVVSASPSTVTINKPVSVNVAISNTGSAMTLTSIKISATYNGAPLSKIPAAYSTYNFGPNAPGLSLPANLTTNIPMQAIFFSPSTGITGTGTGKFYVGATFTTSDGSVVKADTAGQVTVNPVPLPASQRL
jgi:hypothetical protein